MKKLILSILLFTGLQVTAQKKETATIGSNYILCVGNNKTQTTYYITDTSRESSTSNISLSEAFPDGKYDSTLDGICFLLREDYYVLYLNRTKTKYICYNLSKNTMDFFDKFLKDVENVSNIECNDLR